MTTQGGTSGVESIKVELDSRILKVRLLRPERRNALTLEMYAVLSSALARAEADPQVRVVLLAGSGGSFCSGNDVNAFPADPRSAGPTPVMHFVEALVRTTVPVVAAVEGVAAGIGSTLLLHCDAVVGDAATRIVFPFLNMALVPEAGSSLLLTRQLGYTRAADLMLRAASIEGAEAHRLGILSTLAAPGEVERTALAIAAELAAKPPQAMRRSKRLLKGDVEALLQRIRDEERELFEGLASEEGAEALGAFREKRRPDFSRF